MRRAGRADRAQHGRVRLSADARLRPTLAEETNQTTLKLGAGCGLVADDLQSPSRMAPGEEVPSVIDREHKRFRRSIPHEKMLSDVRKKLG